MSCFRRLGRQCFIMVLTSPFRVKRQVELVVPAKLKARFRERIVTLLGGRMPFRQISRMGGDFIGHDPGAYVLFIRQPKCSFGVT